MSAISTYDARLSELKDIIKKTEYLKYTVNSLLYWDKLTYMPPDGIDYRINVVSFLADEQYKLMSGSRFKSCVKYLEGNKKNDETTDAMIKRIQRSSQYINKVPEAEYREYAGLMLKAEMVWEEAKNKDDFEIFRPLLEEIFAIFQKFSRYWGPSEDPYDALMGYYEEGLTVKKADEILETLKPFLVQAVSKLKEKNNGAASENIKFPPIDRDRQQKVWEFILEKIGFNFEAGRVDISSHPTVLASSPSDVRILNSYREEDFCSGLFNVLHSGGKGIYQQSISEELLGTFLAEVPSFAIEESIGRLYENIIGKSKGFWTYFYDDICNIVPELKGFTPEQIYEEVNAVRPSLIRIEADQVTYLLHIIIRYEIEREIINGRLSTEDIPKVWNKKYGEYLGVVPFQNRDGALQDIHWAAGYVGYFPSYLVASLAMAQIAAAIEKDCGELESLIADGRFEVIKSWLHEHIFRFGAVYSTDELVERATGKPVSTEDYIAYLRKRFSEVYK